LATVFSLIQVIRRLIAGKQQQEAGQRRDFHLLKIIIKEFCHQNFWRYANWKMAKSVLIAPYLHN
jgi:hypothetical protein